MIKSPYSHQHEKLAEAVTAVTELGGMDDFVYVCVENLAGERGHYHSFGSIASEGMVEYLRHLADEMEAQLNG